MSGIELSPCAPQQSECPSPVLCQPIVKLEPSKIQERVTKKHHLFAQMSNLGTTSKAIAAAMRDKVRVAAEPRFASSLRHGRGWWPSPQRANAMPCPHVPWNDLIWSGFRKENCQLVDHSQIWLKPYRSISCHVAFKIKIT